MLLTSKVTGSSPLNPNCTATSVPCPFPVLASEPYSNTLTVVTSYNNFFSERVCTKRCAARHGPNVCELEGPTPILKISNAEIASCDNKNCFDKISIKHAANLKSIL